MIIERLYNFIAHYIPCCQGLVSVSMAVTILAMHFLTNSYNNITPLATRGFMNGLTRISLKNGVAKNFSQQTPEKYAEESKY